MNSQELCIPGVPIFVLSDILSAKEECMKCIVLHQNLWLLCVTIKL